MNDKAQKVTEGTASEKPSDKRDEAVEAYPEPDVDPEALVQGLKSGQLTPD